MPCFFLFTLEQLVRKDAPSSAMTSAGAAGDKAGAMCSAAVGEKLGAGPGTSGRTLQGPPPCRCW